MPPGKVATAAESLSTLREPFSLTSNVSMHPSLAPNKRPLLVVSRHVSVSCSAVQALVRGKPGNALPDSPSPQQQQQRQRPGAMGRGAAAAAAAAAGVAAAGAAADPLDGSRFWREVSGIDDLDEDEDGEEEEDEEGEGEAEAEEDMPQVGPSRTRGET